jgi:hypothetical protein
MAFIHQILANLEAEGLLRGQSFERADRRERIAVPFEVLRFAPKKVRPQLEICDDERLRRLEVENANWRERAMHAEKRLKTIERTIQDIAARVRSPQIK